LAKRCYGSKMNMDKFIKEMIGLAESMRGGDMIRWLLMSQRSEKFYNVVQWSSRRFQGYNPFHSNFKGITNDE
jgi:hypothetical protein